MRRARRSVSAAVRVALGAASVIAFAGPPPPPTPVPPQECPGAVTAEPIPDPRAWSRACLCGATEAGGAEACTLIELERDLDLDGKPELLLGAVEVSGNAGGPYLFFRATGGSFRYLGSLFLHPQAFKVLPPGPDGRPRVVLYRRLGPDRGKLCTVAYDGRTFLTVEEEEIAPSGRDRERYESLFPRADGAPAPRQR